MGDYQTILSDLNKAATAFHDGAADFEKAVGDLARLHYAAGDSASLHTVADELNPCEGKVKTTVDDIDGKIGAISGAAGWSGDAAKAFEGHWEVSSAAAGAIGSYCSAAGKVIGDLAGLLDR